MTQNKFINTLETMFHHHPKEDPMLTDPVETNAPGEIPPLVNPEPPPTVIPPAPEPEYTGKTVQNILIAGSGGDRPELHVVFTTPGIIDPQLFVKALSNPVTLEQITDILSALD